jgi:peptidyl-prolyl cis-trans isomerase SurA
MRSFTSKSLLFSRPLLFFVALSISFGAGKAYAQDEKVLDEIVAVIGNNIILQSEVDGYVLGVISQQEVSYSDDLWRSALDQLVNEKVLVIHAKRDTNMVVTDQEVDQGLTDRIDQMKAQVGGQARLEDLYGKTVIEIKAELREDYRDQILQGHSHGRSGLV